MNPRGIVLERHRYGMLGPAVHLEDRMQAVSVTKDILGKEDTQITLLGPFSDATTQFTPGDFAVLRTRAHDTPSQPGSSGVAWNWGRVSAVRSTTTRAANGQLTHAPYTVLTQGWFDMLGRTKVHVFESRNLPSVGTAFNITDWMAIAATLNGMFGQDAGVMLDYIVKKLVRIRLPESLGGGWLSDEVRIVHDTDTARKYAREFLDIESVSFGRLMPSVTQRLQDQRATDVGSLLNGMFVPEPMLIELFPYLSAGGEVEQTATPQSSQSTVTYAEPMTKLGQILGRQPVIVYRIKPFRADPLYSATVSKVNYKEESPEIGYVIDSQTTMFSPDVAETLNNARKEARQAGTVLLKQDGFFNQQTFNSASCVPLPWDYVTSMTRQRADSERVNAATIHVAPPEDSKSVATTSLDGVGLPIMVDGHVEAHGLRLRVSQWPFYTPVGGSSQNLPVFYRAVAAQIMQFYQYAHFYDFGTLSTHFAHALKLTEDATGPNSARTNYSTLLPDLEPGRWFRLLFRSEYFGYITSTQHAIQRTSAGNLTANTVINFIRGHFSEEWPVLNGAVVPIGPVDYPLTNASTGSAANPVLNGGGGSGQRAPGAGANQARSSVSSDPRCILYKNNEVLLRQFNQGVPISTFTTAPNDTQRPLFLKCWLLEATNVSQSAYDKILNALNATGAEAQYANNIWALAACCYVIECYWRIKYPKSRLRIASIPRNNDGFHGLFAAADFYLEMNGSPGPRPGALQMWGGLFKLILSGRIPEGGQGVYLNVNPTTGIKGVKPEEAGSASASPSGGLYPPGGSSFTHYDIAGSFGDISLPSRNGPFSWLSVDWIGDGHDQLTRVTVPYADYIAAINRTKDPKLKKQRLDNLETGGTPSDLDDVLAGIADPGLLRLTRLSQTTPTPQRVTKLLGLRTVRIAAGVNDEDARVPLREAVRQYFTSRGRNDPSLHDVDATVPNALQVLSGLNWGLSANSANNVTPVQTAPPVQGGSTLRHGKFTAAPSEGAPFIAVYGGTDVTGTPSGTYMYNYIMPKLTAKNNVYVAASYRVPGLASYDEGFAQVKGTPSKRILYMFSGGELPCRKIYDRYGGSFDKIYLVDPFLAQSGSQWDAFIKNDPEKFVFVYTPIPSNGPMRATRTTPMPINRENGMNQSQLNLILAHASDGMQVIKVDLTTPTPTDAQLLETHMFTNEKAVDHMVRSRIIIT